MADPAPTAAAAAEDAQSPAVDAAGAGAQAHPAAALPSVGPPKAPKITLTSAKRDATTASATSPPSAKKSLVCPECTAVLASKYGLKRHRNMVHDNVRPLQCPRGCGYDTAEHSHMSALGQGPGGSAPPARLPRARPPPPRLPRLSSFLAPSPAAHLPPLARHSSPRRAPH